MSDLDTLIFRNHDGVGGVPDIDGFVDLDMLEIADVPELQPETGFIGGSQLSFANGSIPPVLFRGIRNGSNGNMVLAFLCRLNTAFHEDSAVSIVIKPSHGSIDRTAWRKINIFPVNNGGAEGAGGFGGNDVRADRDPNDSDYYEGDATGGWTEIASGLPTDIEIKVRSWIHNTGSTAGSDRAWSVEVSLPPAIAAIEAGSSACNLTDDFGLYFKVDKFIAAGTGGVTEYIFPLDAPLPDPTDLDQLSLSTYDPTAFGHGLQQSAIPAVPDGISFENGWQGIGRRPEGSASTTLESWIESDTDATNGGDGLNNEIVALIRNDGSSNATGITAEFRFANWGLGPLGLNLWDAPLGLLPNPTIAVNANAGDTNVALVANWPVEPTNLVPPEYQTARHQCMWAQLTSTSTVNFAQSSVRRNMNFHPLSSVEDEAEVSGKGHPEPANGTDEHDFILQTVSRQITVSELIENPKTADPSALALARDAILATEEDQDDRPDGQDFDRNRIASSAAVARRGSSRFKNTIIFVWVTEGFRITNRTITIRKNTYPVLDNGCGSFGIVARHEGVADPLSWEFSGKGMSRFGDGVYALRVPHGKVTRIGIRLAADKGGPKGDQSKDLPRIKELPPQKPGGGKPGLGNEGGGNGGKPEKGGCLGVLLVAAAVPAILLGATWLSGVS